MIQESRDKIQHINVPENKSPAIIEDIGLLLNGAGISLALQ